MSKISLSDSSIKSPKDETEGVVIYKDRLIDLKNNRVLQSDENRLGGDSSIKIIDPYKRSEKNSRLPIRSRSRSSSANPLTNRGEKASPSELESIF